MWKSSLICAIFCILLFYVNHVHTESAAWSYECRNGRCIKIANTNDKNSLSLPVCRLFCGSDPGTLWPKPNGKVRLDNIMARISQNEVQFKLVNPNAKSSAFWEANEKRFAQQIKAKIPKSVKMSRDGSQLLLNIDVKSDDLSLNHETDESYVIRTYENVGVVLVKIAANTIFGARHALETLSQLIVFDNIRNELQVVGEFEIEDRPIFSHRGFLLDTARNYFSVESIKRTIDGMAMVKLNTFHWHITDSQSFPLIVKAHPDLSRLGAYSPEKVYTPEDVQDIYNYAYVRGVIVLPEFDAPAHVGEGWQKKNLTTCFNYQPWVKYCVEAPCGQLNPIKDELYDVLEDIYQEMYTAFHKPRIFHMGGDEVSHSCWNTSVEIKDWMLKKGWGLAESDFMKLWGHFQENALQRVDRVWGEKIPIIMWTSRLTDVPYVQDYLDKDRYIIQIWTTGQDPKITDLLERGYRLILSNYDGLYLDCGVGAWVTEGNNWCSPYIGWHKVYKNNFTVYDEKYRSQFLGAEAALWSEQADEQVLDSKVWPRLSALAERLWTNPTTGWRDAESRMLNHRERLVENGIQAESLEPQWCQQHEGDCPI